MSTDRPQQPALPLPAPARGTDPDTGSGSGEGASTALEALIRKRKQAETPDAGEPPLPPPR
jgi:hypothetical protein